MADTTSIQVIPADLQQQRRASKFLLGPDAVGNCPEFIYFSPFSDEWLL